MVIIPNWMILLVLVWSVACIQQSVAQTATLSQNVGDTVTLPCSLSGIFTFPEWRGPPSLIIYTNQDDASGTINPAAQAAGRLQYASNNRDLILSNAVTSDSGDYRCAYAGQGTHTITLTVNPETTPSSTTTPTTTTPTTPTLIVTSTPTIGTTPSPTPIYPIIIAVCVPVVLLIIFFIICWCCRHKIISKCRRHNPKNVNVTNMSDIKTDPNSN